MTVRIRGRYTVAGHIINESLDVVRRSEVPDLLARWRPHGRQHGTIGRNYTIEAFLTACLAITLATNDRASVADVLRFFASCTPEQLDALALRPDLPLIIEEHRGRRTNPEYNRLWGGICDATASIDPGRHFPARRMTNRDHDEILAGLTDSQREEVACAEARRQLVMNRLVAASVHGSMPSECRGDVVVDETTIDLVKHHTMMGVKPHTLRAAAYSGRFYMRTPSGEVVPSAPTAIKSGFGIGLTAVTRIGPPDGLHKVPPVFVGIDMHVPTSGSIDATKVALDHATANGLLPSARGRKEWPRIIVDMGYSMKRAFADMALTYKFNAVCRYPKPRNPKLDSRTDDTGRLLGPVQIAGAFYCPAVLEHINLEAHVPVMRELWEHAAEAKREGLLSEENPIKRHDDYIARVLPFLMGRNSRPYRGRVSAGRPKLGEFPERVTKVELVCPAALKNIRCPLRPDSHEAAAGTPSANPSWTAEDYVCCGQSTVTVPLTADQDRRLQWWPVAGTWEHGLYLDACRTLTEQRFDRLKSPDGAGVENLWHGVRREPLIALSLAIACSAVNLETQRHFNPRAEREESIDIRRRQLRRYLGSEPTKPPPLT